MSPTDVRFRVLNSSFGFYRPEIDGAVHHARQSELPFDVVRMEKNLPAPDFARFIRDNGPFHGILAGLQRFDVEVLDALVGCARELNYPRVCISRDGVGFDEVDLPSALARGIAVAFTDGVNCVPVAERAIAMMLALSQRLFEQHDGMMRGEWKPVFGNQLSGRSLGIFGFGHVGRQVAFRAMALGMHVKVYDPKWETDDAWAAHAEAEASRNQQIFPTASIGRAQTVEGALRDSDIVTLHMNSSPENVRFLNRERIRLCRRGVIIVNTARGDLVHTEMMAAALDFGQVYRYGADVFEDERATSFKENPLCGRKDVILTPHTASWTIENRPLQSVCALDNLLGMLTGGEVSQYIVRPPHF